MGRSRHKKGSLATKLTLTIASVVIVTVTGVTILSMHRERRNFRSELQQQAKNLISSLHVATSDALYFQNIDFLEEILEQLREEQVLVSGFIYNREARIIADAYDVPEDEWQIFNLNSDPFGEKLLKAEKTVFKWESNHLLAGRKVVAGNQVLGAISIRLSTSPLQKKMTGMVNQGLAIALLSTAVGTSVALLFSRSLTDPLQEMITATEGLAQGDLSQKIAIHTNDELAILARTFNIMTDRLRGSIESLEKQAQELRQSEALLKNKALRETLINNLTHQIRQSLDLDNILTTAVQGIYSLLQIDSCRFFWYREQDPTIPMWDCVKEAQNLDISSQLGEYPVNRVSPLHQRILNLELIQLNDVSTFSSELNSPQLGIFSNFSALLALPIMTRKGEIGLVCCGQMKQPRQWQNTEVKLLETICDQLVIAISQASLYQEATEAAKIASQRASELEQALKELQRTQAQLIQNEKMASLGQLVAGVAHEINNPVGFIQGNVSFAKDYAADLISLVQKYQKYYTQPIAEIHRFTAEIDLEYLLEDFPKLLKSMEVGAERIGQIVLSLRNFSRLDEAQMKEVDIHEGIESALMILQSRLKNTPSHPEIEVIKAYGSLPKVMCYPGQLNQVFLNLIANSIDALEALEEQDSIYYQTTKIDAPEPKIWISTELIETHQVAIAIKDNGRGIPEAIQHRLFDPFFTTKPVGKGTGLGLSISYQIVVERHNGDLSCISATGEGTQFNLTIPLHPH